MFSPAPAKLQQHLLSLQNHNPTKIHFHCTYFDRSKYSETLYQDHKLCFPQKIKTAKNKRQQDFLAGRYCAQKALMALQYESFDLHIGLQRQPIWPDNIQGSISHSHNLAAAIAATTSQENNILGLGLDIEHILDHKTAMQIKSVVLNQDEKERFKRLLTSSRILNNESLISLIFSVKESFFKAVHPLVNRIFEFSAVSILQIENRQMLLRLNEDIFPVDSNYKIGHEFIAYFDIETNKWLVSSMLLIKQSSH